MTFCALSMLVANHFHFRKGHLMRITSPFNAESAAEVISGHDLTGKTALVTNASSGLGIETARALLCANAEVVLAVHSRSNAQR
jgi:hypothetical protein